MKTAKPLKDRLAAKSEIDANGCWVWTGKLKPDGYVQIRVVGRGLQYAHRIAYEEYIGPIPEGMTLDHLCRNPRCINPEHLEAVTHRENVLRGISPSAVAAAKTHCPRGHPYDRVDKYGHRHCTICHNYFGAIRKREYRRRARQEDGVSRLVAA